VVVVGETPRHVVARPLAGCREREPGRLQLRVVHHPDEHVDDIILAEDDELVAVLGLVCIPAAGSASSELWDVPVNVHLERPLGDRAVVDGCTGERLPLVRSAWD
jgi:hypothetical protein